MNFLPGWAGGFGGALGPVTSLTFFAAVEGGAATTIALPVGLKKYDVAVLIDRGLGGEGGTNDVTPTNWEDLISQADWSEAVLFNVSGRIIQDASESEDVIAGNVLGEKVLLVYRPNGIVTTLTRGPANPVAGENATGNPTPQVIEADSLTPPMVLFGLFRGSNPFTTSVLDFSPAQDRFTAFDGNDPSTFWVGDKIYNTSPADTTVDMPDVGSQQLGSFSLRVA